MSPTRVLAPASWTADSLALGCATEADRLRKGRQMSFPRRALSERVPVALVVHTVVHQDQERVLAGGKSAARPGDRARRPGVLDRSRLHDERTRPVVTRAPACTSGAPRRGVSATPL